MKVIKRDGRIVDFDAKKISNALIASVIANKFSLKSIDVNNITDIIVKNLKDKKQKDYSVEAIQDIVIATLYKLKYSKLAKKYETYRKERSKIRERNSNLMNVITKIGIQTDKDNANVGNNFSAKLLRIASVANKWHILTKLLPIDIAKYHENGDYYIHDLDSYNLTTNCLHLPTYKLLKEGFNTGYGTILPAKNIESAAAILCIALQASQNDMFGGQSHPNFDNDLADVVELTRKKIINTIKEIGGDIKNKKMIENILEKRIKQAMQAVIYNLNTMHSRAGSQVPFSSLNIGIPKNDDAALICKYLLLEYEKGLGNGEQPIFPNIIFRIKDGVNKKPNDKYYYLFELAARVASLRMNPTFMNIDSDFNKQYYQEGIIPATMGCRTYLMSNINGKDGVYGRGNNAPCTINLVRLAIKAKKNLKLFFKLLEKMCVLVKDQLLHRFSVLKKLKVKDLPFVTGQHLMVGSEKLNRTDSIEAVMKNGTWAIGFIGLAETLKLLVGKHHGESEKAQKLGLKIVKTIRDNCDKFKKKYHLNFSCYATPAEGLSDKFTVLDEKLYGSIPWVTTKGFYTNSFHVPVDYPCSIAHKIKIEAPYHKLCNAGHISFIEFDSYPTTNDVIKVITYAFDKTNIGYVGINFFIRYCADCSNNDEN